MDLPTLLDSYPVAAPAIDELCGTWYIVKTTLAMWRERRNPTVAYARLPGGAVRLRDEINYLNRAGRPRRLLGIDTQDARDPRIFCWRGAAWYTRLLTSQWCFVDHDPASALPAQAFDPQDHDHLAVAATRFAALVAAHIMPPSR